MTGRELLDRLPGTIEPGRARRRWLRVVLAGGVALAVVAGLVSYVLTPASSSPSTGSSAPGGTMQRTGPGAGLPKLTDGAVAPPFTLPSLGGGGPVSLAEERGHPVVLNFFASWCPNCRAELGAFAHVSDGPHGAVRFLAVDTNDPDTGTALALLRSAGDHYPVGVDRSAAIASGRYLVEALPVTVFISAAGHVVGEAFGAQTVQSLEAWVRALEGADRPG